MRGCNLWRQLEGIKDDVDECLDDAQSAKCERIYNYVLEALKAINKALSELNECPLMIEEKCFPDDGEEF